MKSIRNAERADRVREEFLAMLGHELRTPLAAISNAAEVIRSEERTPEQLELAAGIIHRQSGHLKQVVNDLLDLERMMSGRIRLDRDLVDLGASMRQVLLALRTAGALEGRRVELLAPSIWVDGDEARLEQIVGNLLVNAAAHTARGDRIRVTLAAEEGAAVLTVHDDGAGIAPENLPRVFEIFFQGDRPPGVTGAGLGIGLTLVKRLVELHGGSVTAHSEGPGHGAVFTARLPGIAATDRKTWRARRDSNPQPPA